MNTGLAAPLFNWVIHVTWQASVVVALVLAIQVLFRSRLSPTWRYRLWLLLVVRLLLPGSIEAPFSIYNLGTLMRIEASATMLAPHSDFTTGIAKGIERESRVAPQSELVTGSNQNLEIAPPSPAPASAPLPVQPRPWLLYIWSLGAAYFALRLVYSNLRFQREIADARDVTARCSELLSDARALFACKQNISVYEVVNIHTPAVYGLFRKKLLLPIGYLERFTASELRHIFNHELAHIHRSDLEMGWLIALLQVLHWFNPILWFAFARMRADRELATDALALSRSAAGSADAYGETILKVLAGFRSSGPLPQIVGVIETRSQIEQRIRLIAHHGLRRTYTHLAVVLTILLAGVALTDSVKDKKEVEPENAKSENNSSRRFEVELLDKDTSAPIRAAVVHVEMEDYIGNSVTKQLRTDESGRAVLELPTDDLKKLTYRTEAGEYLSLWNRWDKQETKFIPSPLQLKLGKGTEIGGIVLTPDGKPLEGAELYFDRPMNMILSEHAKRPQVYDVKWSVAAGELVARTDALGHWQSRAIWHSVRWAELRVRHPDFADTVFSTELTEALAQEKNDHRVEWSSLTNKTAQLTMDQGRTVSGRLTDPQGAPLSGMMLRYSDRKSENPFWDTLMGVGNAITDSDGKFQLAHLPVKRIYFSAYLPGYAPLVSHVDPGTVAAHVDLRLAKPQPFSGTIKDHSGAPASGVKILFQDWGPWQGIRWETTTDQAGSFQWPDAPPEQFSLLIEKEGFLPERKIAQGGDRLEVRLRPYLRLFGKVTDSKTGEPVQSFRVLYADRPERLENMRGQALPFRHGNYVLDLGQLSASTWQDRYFHRFIFRVEADGYLPFTSQTFSSRDQVGQRELSISITPVAHLAGTIVDSEDKPIRAAQYTLRYPGARLRLAGKPRFEQLDVGIPETDENGAFSMSPNPEASHLLVVHEKGFAFIETKSLSSKQKVQLQPWARIEGTVQQYDTPLPNQEIHLSSGLFQDTPWHGIQFLSALTTSDAQGRFAFNYLPAAKVALSRRIPKPNGWSSGPQNTIELRAGELAKVRLGGTGRPVVGRVEITNPYVPIDFSREHHYIHSVRKEGQPVRNYPIVFKPDGAFRIDEVEPGEYQFSISLYDPRDPEALAYSKYIAHFNKSFEVPDSPDRNSTRPHDLGVFAMELNAQLQEGVSAAPKIQATDLQGRAIRLEELKGKVVFVDFWASWCSPCIADIPYIQKAYEHFKDREDVVLIGMSFDKTIGDAEKFVTKHKLGWRQAFVPDAQREAVQRDYAFRGLPAKFLINRDGTIAGKDFAADDLVPRINAALQRTLSK